MTTRPRTRAALKVMPFPFESALKLPRANRTLARIHTSGCQLPLEEHDRNQIDEASKPLKWRTAWKGRRLRETLRGQLTRECPRGRPLPPCYAAHLGGERAPPARQSGASREAREAHARGAGYRAGPTGSAPAPPQEDVLHSGEEVPEKIGVQRD